MLVEKALHRVHTLKKTESPMHIKFKWLRKGKFAQVKGLKKAFYPPVFFWLFKKLSNSVPRDLKTEEERSHQKKKKQSFKHFSVSLVE